MIRTENFKPAKHRPPVARILFFTARILLLALLLRFFLVEGYTQRGMNMFPAVLPGDSFLVNRFVYGLRIPPFRAVRLPSFSSPDRGDLVVFHHPGSEAPSGLSVLLDYLSLGLLADSGESLHTGRIAGRSGDRIRLDSGGRLYRNGKRVTGEGREPVALVYRYRGGRVSVFWKNRVIADRDSLFKGTGNRRMRAVRAGEGGYAVLLPPGESLSPFPPDVAGSPAALEGFVNSFLAGNLPFRDGLPLVAAGRKVKSGEDVIRYALKPGGGLVVRHPAFDNPLDLIRQENGSRWLVVPEGYYFILNDNRLLDSDSRTFGLVPKNRIEGSYLFRVRPAGGKRPVS